jgi:hypothetical protein
MISFVTEDDVLAPVRVSQRAGGSIVLLEVPSDWVKFATCIYCKHVCDLSSNCLTKYAHL